jgi:hypothetical protein
MPHGAENWNQASTSSSLHSCSSPPCSRSCSCFSPIHRPLIYAPLINTFRSLGSHNICCGMREMCMHVKDRQQLLFFSPYPFPLPFPSQYPPPISSQPLTSHHSHISKLPPSKPLPTNSSRCRQRSPITPSATTCTTRLGFSVCRCDDLSLGLCSSCRCRSCRDTSTSRNSRDHSRVDGRGRGSTRQLDCAGDD